MKRAFFTYAVVVQVMAILLLQFYQIAPHLSNKPIQPQCFGNHVQCGCSPEKIVSRTCCCYHARPESCDKEQHHEEERIAKRGVNTSSPNLHAVPCGGTSKFSTVSLDKLKFLRPEVPSVTPVEYSHSFSFPGRETAPDRFTEPPVPPPKPALIC